MIEKSKIKNLHRTPNSGKLKIPPKAGFTLIEIMEAVAIIALIISMVYGSFSATSRATETCKNSLSMSSDAYKVLEQIACQIRCAYASSAALTSKEENKSKNKPNYFNSNPEGPAGEILNLVTTHAIANDRSLLEGLFKVTYKFDRRKGILSINQQRFSGDPESAFEKKGWRELVKDVESVELTFFDGKQWLIKWDFKDKAKLPRAVRINLTLIDENHRLHDNGTVAYICGQNNHIEPKSAKGG
jgi:prepilin-type N-terminal cleavage/methylation domain-containing protein